jgi:CheY-like chemotaxis protein
MSLNVLIIEDNVVDAMLLQQALAREAQCDCTVIDQGDEAVEYLRGIAEKTSAAIPQLILLDLNLPGADGVEVFNFVRSKVRLREIPVAVVSSSPREILLSKAADADCYITKPSNLEEYLAIGRELLSCIRASPHH